MSPAEQHSVPGQQGIHDLLVHADWLRALARRLVADPSSADDVEQEVWRQALEAPPRDRSNPRGWLAAVARNVARTIGRARSRRNRRELAAARPEALPDTSELVLEAELSRTLAGEVLELAEPYRTVLLLRYWRGLSSEDIAAARGVPHETVRTQLRRGVERLRERLDAKHGGREAWVALYAPLARELATMATATLAPASVGWATWTTIAATLCIAGAIAWSTRAPDGAATTALVAVDLEDGARAAPSGAFAPKEPVEDAGARVAMASGQPTPPKSAEGLAGPVAGRCVRPDGSPVAGVRVRWTPGPHASGPRPRFEDGVLHARAKSEVIAPERLAKLREDPMALSMLLLSHGDEPDVREAVLGLPLPDPRATSGSDGRFEAVVPNADWRFALDAPAEGEGAFVVVAEIGKYRSEDWTLVVAPAVLLSGVLVDGAGAPVEGGVVEAGVHLASLRELAFDIDDLKQRELVHAADAEGRFALLAPVLAGARWRASAGTLHAPLLPVPPASVLDLRIVLRPGESLERPALVGRVLEADGAPADGAEVAWGDSRAKVEDDGSFVLPITPQLGPARLVAWKKGRQAAFLEDVRFDADAASRPIELRLGARPLAIRGRVLDASGAPRARVQVALLDGLKCGLSELEAEHLTVGRKVPLVRTGRNGEFTLDGLRDKAYDLVAWDESGVVALSRAVPAGAVGVDLRGGPDEWHEEVRCRVVDAAGEALAGVVVELHAERMRDPLRVELLPLARATSDSEGRCVLRRAPRQGARLAAAGVGFAAVPVAVPSLLEGEIELRRVRELRVDLAVDDASVDELRFLGGDGEELGFVAWLPMGPVRARALPRVEGAFAMVDLVETATTVVFRSNGAEIGRRELRFSPDGVTRLRW
jgi:RNA polymerase sigma-70 factor (ECF subfamily)